MQRASSLWMLSVLTAFVGACTSAAADGSTPLDARAGSLGLLQVERVAEGYDDVEVAELGAAFARYRGIDGDAVVRLLGGGHGTELESCGLVQDDFDSLASSEATVDLLDVGAIDVRVGDAETHLVPRMFPELARVAAGFFYAGDTSVALETSAIEEYSFHAEGGTELPGFDVAVPAPLDPVGVVANNAELAGLDFLARDRDIELAWDASDPRDQMELEIESHGHTLACRTHDSGAFRISAAALALLPADTEARVIVRRVRVSPFDAAGVDVAYVRLSTTRVFDISLR